MPFLGNIILHSFTLVKLKTNNNIHIRYMRWELLHIAYTISHLSSLSYIETPLYYRQLWFLESSKPGTISVVFDDMPLCFPSRKTNGDAATLAALIPRPWPTFDIRSGLPAPCSCRLVLVQCSFLAAEFDKKTRWLYGWPAPSGSRYGFSATHCKVRARDITQNTL